MDKGTWCRELTCEGCGHAFFAPLSTGRYPTRCTTCVLGLQALTCEQGDVLCGPLAEVCQRAAGVRPRVDKHALVVAIARAGRARGVPAQHDTLLNLSAVALALASRTPADHAREPKERV